MTLVTVNPATGQRLHSYEEHSPAEALALLTAAAAAQSQWSRVPLVERIQAARRLGDLLTAERDEHAALVTREMGKPIGQSRAEIEKCAWGCRHLAEHVASYLAPRVIPTDASLSYVSYQPLGVVLGVMPWNFPYWQVVRFALPALLAGNAALLKHAEATTGCGIALESLFRRAGFPKDAFAALLVGHATCAEVIAQPAVRAVSLTGSSSAGREVAQVAGRFLKKLVLELGGSDPYVVLEDADLDLAVASCVTARMLNAGQSCIAGKRFIVVEAVREAFTGRLVEAMRRQRVGDPLDPATEVGPLARADLRVALQRQVDESVRCGAELLLGGAIPLGEGAYYPPTVLARVAKGMPAADEEVFGPVACILPARNEAHALALANDCEFGLGAAVFTRDLHRGERIAREELLAGSCFVNGFVKSDPRLPFGGVKQSGYGRELSEEGIREFTNAKTVWVR